MLSLQHLSKAFGAIDAVRDISLEIRRGEFIAVVGPSGCGKTTLMRLIAGFEQPTHGNVLLDGRDITHLSPQSRNIGMVFQNYALFPHMSVRENIAFGLKAQKRPASEIIQRTERAASSVRLSHKLDSVVPVLSGGEQQRVALARAIVTEPRLLLLDEPLSNLDPVLREEMRAEIARVQHDTGLTTMYVTHDQGEAMVLADRIVVLRAGRLEQCAHPRDAYFHPQNCFVASFMGGAQILPATTIVSGNSLRAEIVSGLGVPFFAEGEFSNIRAGDTITVAIKPEAIRFDVDGTPGIVRSRAFLGGSTEYEIEVGPTLFHARVRSAPEWDYSTGDEVTIAIDDRLCTVFPP